MNHVLDMLEELMVKVEQHEITFIIFSVIALLYLEAISPVMTSALQRNASPMGTINWPFASRNWNRPRKNSAVSPSTTSASPARWALKPVCCRRTPSRRRWRGWKSES